MPPDTLADAATAKRFYDERFAAGYMDRWEAGRMRRIADVLAAIELPAGARVLDFGCGSGGMTRLLVARFPDAVIEGVDISEAAIRSARTRDGGAGVRFHVLDDDFVRDHRGRFDFVFSHHVLEHVVDLDATVADVASLLAPGGRMLHALPCGNAGSLPHWLCALRASGIDPARGNRFYFEDPSHLRRCRTDDLERAFATHGCGLERAAYGYHRFGALRLFTEMAPAELRALLLPSRGGSLPAMAWVFAAFVVAWWALRLPCQVLMRTRRMLQQVRRYHTRRLADASCLALLGLAIPAAILMPASLPFELSARALDAREWRTRRRDPRGSEMLLEFRRRR